MQNKELLQKADLAVADLTANGGLLSPEQSDTFIRNMIAQPTLLNTARVVRMNAPQMKVNKIGFGQRILRPAPASGTALAAVDRSAPTTSQITLTSKEVIAEINLPYDVIEDNIERGTIGTRNPETGGIAATGGLKDTIMALISERAALDLEELALLGDTASADTYLALADGYLKQAVTNVVDAGGAPISKAVFKAGIKTMPDQYLRNRAALRHYVSIDNETEFRDSLANRETALGDANLQGNNRLFAFGSPVEPVALMPATGGLLTNPQNLLFGIQRDMHLEVDKDIRSRSYIIVLTARVDFAIEQEDAVVKYTNIA